ncbi:unnamed protein product, partial [Strongylus vulgaris]
KSGVGYSDFSNTIYQHRPYIWPPLRKLFNVNFVIIAAGLFLISIDFEWLMKQIKLIGNGLKPEASQLAESPEGKGETSDSVHHFILKYVGGHYCGRQCDWKRHPVNNVVTFFATKAVLDVSFPQFFV